MAWLDNFIEAFNLDEASGNAVGAYAGIALTETSGTIDSVSTAYGNFRDFEAGDTEYLTAADSPALSTGDTDLTIAIRLQLESKSATMDVLGKLSSGAASNLSEYTLRYDNSLDRFSWYFSRGVGGGNWSQVNADNYGSVPTGSVIFVVVKHDKTNDLVSINVNNGTPNTAATTGLYPDDVGCGFSIGRPGDYDGVYWDGLVGRVYIWKRLITGPEETDLFNGVNPLTGGAAQNSGMFFGG